VPCDPLEELRARPVGALVGWLRDRTRLVARAKRYALCRRTVGVRTAWIFGAGASKAAYCGMPLVKDFMEEALHRLRLSGNQGSRLVNFIRDAYGYEDPKDVDVEELLTFAWCDVSNLGGQGDSPLPDAEQLRLYRAKDTLRKVEDLIVAVLFQAQRECIQIGDRVHDSLAEKVDKAQDTVISYNYYLLVDHALWKAEKASSDDYGVAFDGAYDGGPGPTVREYIREPKIKPGCQEVREGVPLLKLHGSLNWLGLEHADLFKREPEVFYLPAAIHYSVSGEFWWTGFGSLRPADGSDDISRSGTLRPIIVPPAFAKDVWRRSPMAKLWPKARVAIQRCDRVVIIGLSLREADYQTRWLLRTALTAGRPRDVEIDIVNPSPEDRDRLHRFFLGLGRAVPYESVDEFLAGRTAA